jgi:hypothetical protein
MKGSGKPMMTTSDLLSIGSIAATAQRGVSALLSAASRLGLQPTLTLDRVPYFTAADAEKLVEAIQSRTVSDNAAAVRGRVAKAGSAR